MLTDPIADMLTRIRNANKIRNKEVIIPASTMKVSIAKILLEEGYIQKYDVVPHFDSDNKKTDFSDIKVTLKYDVNNQPALTDLKRISKPGLRIYADVEKMPRVLNGLGIAIISTSKGIMTDKEARKQRVGGEVLAYVW